MAVHTPAVAQLLQLQRSAGNRAVRRLVVQRGGACCSSCAGGGSCEDRAQEVQRDDEPITSDVPVTDDAPVTADVPVTDELTASSSAGSCPTFSTMSGWTHSNRGESDLAAQTGWAWGRTGNTFSARLDTGSSWVNTYYVPQGNARTGRSSEMVSDCRASFTGGNSSPFTSSPDGTCPAAGGGSHTANNAGECESVIGTNLDLHDRADVPRLLRHEQYHLKLICALASKATAAVAAGSSTQTVEAQMNTAATRETARYDSSGETNHGCDAAKQATWQSDIDAGNVVFP